MTTENKKGESYNKTALILLSVLVPLLLCGGCAFIWLHPWITWFHVNEMQTVLDNYEHVRSAVFEGREQPEYLQQIAVQGNLEQLQQSLTGPNSQDKKYTAPQPIIIEEIREYEANCSVVIVSPYFNRLNVGFILMKTGGMWKVQRVVNDANAGLFGPLPLRVCNTPN